ncbi:MAG: sugar phosphate isomerase/epimerase [Spirochaetes bacterium]|nr:sugar phosphate isomerase/epimerase [Spirochaetota bacterium]
MLNYKNRFNFTLGTTSYILHDEKNNLIKNIKFLKDHFNVIQLLYFGKDYLEDLINTETINEIIKIKRNSGLSFIIHLPLDLRLLHPEKDEFENSVRIINRIIEKTKILEIQKYILHIDRYNFLKNDLIELNMENHVKFEEVLNKLESKLNIDPSSIFIENTGFDLVYFSDIILKKNFNICFDIGHLFLNGLDFNKFINVFKDKIGVIHLHGFNDNKDHLSLDNIKGEHLSVIFDFLKNYDKTLILEVFNEKDLTDSLKILELNKKFLKSTF